MSADDSDISPLLGRISEHRGLDFTQYRENTVRRRINRRMTARNCADLPSYISLLDADPSEYDSLLRDLTVKYTEFFRDSFVFDILREQVLPQILNRKQAGDRFQIWSAGCATGEEAYSLAAVVRRMQLAGHCHCQAAILGTDIDQTAIVTARSGIYGKHVLPVLPYEWAMAYFSDDDTAIAALPEIRNLVSFQVHNLLSPAPRESVGSGGFDLVLCRNVLIYLKRSAQARVVELLVEMLVPGGFLIVGTGESIPEHLRDSLAIVDQKASIYRLIQE